MPFSFLHHHQKRRTTSAAAVTAACAQCNCKAREGEHSRPGWLLIEPDERLREESDWQWPKSTDL